MRVIEPHQFKQRQKSKLHLHISKVWIIAISGLLAIGMGYVASQGGQKNNTGQDVLGSDKKADQRVSAPSATANLKQFTSQQFQAMFENMVLAYPNTEPLLSPPEITGNVAADTRIRSIAQQRGYILRSVPVLPIIKTAEIRADSDDLMQPRAYNAWKQLKSAASKNGIPLQLNSGYRSVNWQRDYFIARLRALGVSNEQIASGRADNSIINVMHVVAPPGYSRHHTGYTADLVCRDGTGKAFEFTVCFSWLKNNNYEVAKTYGWIPSYPDGVDDQGPEPEPWEYVWVGHEQLR